MFSFETVLLNIRKGMFNVFSFSFHLVIEIKLCWYSQRVNLPDHLVSGDWQSYLIFLLIFILIIPLDDKNAKIFKKIGECMITEELASPSSYLLSRFLWSIFTYAQTMKWFSQMLVSLMHTMNAIMRPEIPVIFRAQCKSFNSITLRHVHRLIGTYGSLVTS